jgi:hypothetical protein
VDLAPDAVQVMPLFGIATTAKQASAAGPETTELTTIVRWYMGVELERSWETETITGQG